MMSYRRYCAIPTAGDYILFQIISSIVEVVHVETDVGKFVDPLVEKFDVPDQAPANAMWFWHFARSPTLFEGSFAEPKKCCGALLVQQSNNRCSKSLPHA